jgi:hypothetical protein
VTAPGTTPPAQPEAPAIPGVTRWRRKPAEPAAIEATHWDGAVSNATRIIDWILAHGGTARYHDDPSALSIDIPGGTINAVPGDWIIRRPDGVFWPWMDGEFTDAWESAPEPLVMPADEFAALRTVAERFGLASPSPAPAGPSGEAGGPAKGDDEAMPDEPHASLLEAAWGIIANAGWDAFSGRVDLPKTTGWHEAAVRWRDDYGHWLDLRLRPGGYQTWEELAIGVTRERDALAYEVTELRRTLQSTASAAAVAPEGGGSNG